MSFFVSLKQLLLLPPFAAAPAPERHYRSPSERGVPAISRAVRFTAAR